MKSIQSVIGQKVAIHCETEQQFLEISELLKYEWVWPLTTYNMFMEFSAIRCDMKKCGYVDGYRDEGYTILPASDFLDKSDVDVAGAMNTIVDGLGRLHELQEPDSYAKALATNLINQLQILKQHLKSKI